MSKIFNLLGLAVLGIALLVGMASAGTTGGATLNGCLLTDNYLELKSNGAIPLVNPVAIGLLPASSKTGGTLEVLAEIPWQITAIDAAGTPLGTMKEVAGSTHLTDPLEINTVPLGTSTPVQIATGSATTDCEYAVKPITYDQDIEIGDTATGKYSIAITYTLQST